MRYLVIDASLSGTGIRNKYEGGYLSPSDLGLNCETMDRLNQWLLNYEYEHYNGFTDDNIVEKLDMDGREIALMIKRELVDVKLEYFSDARMTVESI